MNNTIYSTHCTNIKNTKYSTHTLLTYSSQNTAYTLCSIQPLQYAAHRIMYGKQHSDYSLYSMQAADNSFQNTFVRNYQTTVQLSEYSLYSVQYEATLLQLSDYSLYGMKLSDNMCKNIANTE